MASLYQQTPADLSIYCVQGDEINVAIDASIDLSDYTFEAKVYATTPSSTGSWTGSDGLLVGATEATFSVNVVDLSAGQINLGLSEVQTAAISPASAHRWYLRWTDGDGATRTVLAGEFTTRIP
jgi:hypothetical protein